MGGQGGDVLCPFFFKFMTNLAISLTPDLIFSIRIRYPLAIQKQSKCTVLERNTSLSLKEKGHGTSPSCIAFPEKCQQA